MPLRRKVSVTVTAAAAGDYAANDIISNSATGDAGVAATLANVVDTVGQIGRLVKVNMVCSEDSVAFRPRLHFYDYSPLAADVEMDDNIAADFAKIAAGAAGYLGYVDLPAFADRGTAMAQTQVDDLNVLFATTSTSSSLYVVIQTLDAEANETASMTIRLDTYWDN